MERLRKKISAEYGSKPPLVLDMFSGRGIIPLEAARAGANAIGIDISPVATLAGTLLADYPLRDWSAEEQLPYRRDERLDGANPGSSEISLTLDGFAAEPRLLHDVRLVLSEVARRVREIVSPLYLGLNPRSLDLPWAYLWAVTIPCDGCGRRFPMIGSMVLMHPYKVAGEPGQALKVVVEGDAWSTSVHEGTAQQEPTFAAAAGKRGKSARCSFTSCGHTHSLDVVKAKGLAGQYEDAMLAVAEVDPETNRKVFRPPTAVERAAAKQADDWEFDGANETAAIPDEPIPATSGVDAYQYGYRTYGSLMNSRQAVLFATTAQVIDELYAELTGIVSEEYAKVLASYAAGNLPKQLRRATRGANLLAHGSPDGTKQNTCQVGDVFSKQSVLKHQFDYLEAGPGQGPGTWSSVSSSLVNALKKVLEENYVGGRPGRFRRGSAVSLPYRDRSVDAVVCDPPYYQMIAYADSSDLFHVWFKRALRHVLPDLFGGAVDGADGLQDKSEEIIVKGRGAKGHGDHRTEDFYESMLAKSFTEARRVLKPEGHLTVIFGHSDPDAWKRLLAALTDAGFIVTSSWPSRTETAATGVATISVTVSIGARVAASHRPVGIAAQIDAEVVAEVKRRSRVWDADGLALEDQLMASYGAALQVVGQCSKVITPDGATVPLEHYMTLARRAVRDAVALRLDELPLETFDPHTRLAVFWHELYGRAAVPRGEARFFAQSDELRLEDLRGPILDETKAGYNLRHDAPEALTSASSVYEVVRGMAAAWPEGTDAVAECLALSERLATDAHLWAIVDWLATKLPTSDPVAIALAAVKRNRGTIQASVAAQVHFAAPQPKLFEEIS
ncbi:DUF1156 domain-containing protein [Cryobacterium sp. Hz7]|uniref:DUF1156 domain-containing protein n=1 Tax=Cryobacterium sp. Hz7 TaxID=1259166 RepID=UPI00106CFB9E|nr:DUF1156 domain-containing protein [Cryobacterium sp. Hz7]TFB67195.1 DUF1156 domain-containing protein [Cryobacterium sp. Hz7]